VGSLQRHNSEDLDQPGGHPAVDGIPEPYAGTEGYAEKRRYSLRDLHDNQQSQDDFDGNIPDVLRE